jgi:hypothetical protein
MPAGSRSILAPVFPPPKEELFKRAPRVLLRLRCCFGHQLALFISLRAALTPFDLRCEYAVNPLGVDTPQPRLFWKLESDTRGDNQTAYEILAASSPELLARDQGDLWHSGRVKSDESLHIRYAGKPLKSAQQVFWKVRVWDGPHDLASPWSEPAQLDDGRAETKPIGTTPNGLAKPSRMPPPPCSAANSR